jgi:hypothetical protein
MLVELALELKNYARHLNKNTADAVFLLADEKINGSLPLFEYIWYKGFSEPSDHFQLQ